MKPLRQNNSGLTLIEVLIALAILSIALAAVIRTTSQNILQLLYLQNKTIASWVGTLVINESRLGLLKLPMRPETLNRSIDFLGQNWQYKANLSPTLNKHIRKINVEVYDQSGHGPFCNLASTIYE